MTGRLWSPARAVAAAGAVAALALPASTSASSSAAACALLPAARIASILGLQNVMISKNLPGVSSTDDTSGVVHSLCTGVAWSGPPPTSQAGALAALRRGTGAAFAVETWRPDDQSRYVDTWRSKNFDTLTSHATIVADALPFASAFVAHHPHVLAPAKQGSAVGLTATPRGVTGVVAAIGLWWDDATAKAVGIAFEESSRVKSQDVV